MNVVFYEPLNIFVAYLSLEPVHKAKHMCTSIVLNIQSEIARLRKEKRSQNRKSDSSEAFFTSWSAFENELVSKKQTLNIISKSIKDQATKMRCLEKLENGDEENIHENRREEMFLNA